MDVEGHWKGFGTLASSYPFLCNPEVSSFVPPWNPAYGDSTGPNGNGLKLLSRHRNTSSYLINLFVLGVLLQEWKGDSRT